RDRLSAGEGQREPRGRVGGDSRTADQREKREREPNDRRIHGTGLCDPAADAAERTVRRALDPRERTGKRTQASAHPRRTSTCPTPTSASTTSCRASARGPYAIASRWTPTPFFSPPKTRTLPALAWPSATTVMPFGSRTTRS